MKRLLTLIILFGQTGLALASGGDVLGVDWRVILVQAMGFIVVFFVLKKFLFEPVLRAIEDRREKIKASLDNIASGRTEMEGLKSEYQSSKRFSRST